MRNAKKSISPEEALAKAESLCCKAEYCTSDILTRLSRWGVSSSEAKTIIDTLIKKRFIDNTRFALSFTRDKYRFSGWGSAKIRFALHQKHIPSETISDAIADGIDSEEYFGILLDSLRSKARSIKEGDTYEGRTKLFRFAASRGFEPDLISRAIKTGRLFEKEQ